MLVLLVEDNPADARLTLESLRRLGTPSQVAQVQDGVEALAYLRREGGYAGAERPDLVLLDLNLPRKDGFEVLGEMKRDPELRRIPVVVLTTSEAEEDVVACYDLHANCYIAKPMHLETLVEVARRLEAFWFSTVRLPPR
jgi:CheY-like chemotaxis protein